MNTLCFEVILNEEMAGYKEFCHERAEGRA